MSPRAAPNASPPPSSAPAPTAVVVGGGWAGFGAAWQLVKHGFDVTLLDASPNPGGLSQGWRTANGRAVEAGCKGFWRHYKNIDALCAELRIDPFTPYTSSAFYGPKGRETEAPVFGDLPRLPAPLGTLLYTSPYFRNLSLEDRLSAAPLALDLLRYDADDDAYLRYDARSARDVFLDDAGSNPTGGASQALYDAFLAPVLCALMFARPEELSPPPRGRPLRVRPRAPGRFRRALVSRHRRRANLSTVDQSHPKRRRFDPRRKTRLVHHSGRSPGRLRRRLRLETETSRARARRVGGRLRARRRRRTPTSS